MTLTKEKNNTHKQRTLPNDERLFRGSKFNVNETDINGCQNMAFVAHTQAYAAQAFTLTNIQHVNDWYLKGLFLKVLFSSVSSLSI